MKARLIVRNLNIVLFLLFTQLVNAQSFEVVVSKTLPPFSGKSVYFTQQVTMLPGTVVTAPAQGELFFKSYTPASQPPSVDQNFVRTETILVPGITNEGQISALDASGKTTTYEYLDGLGAASQTVTINGGAGALPGVKDFIEPFEYDQTGRMPKSYLSYSKANGIPGQFVPNAVADQLAFFQAGTEGIESDTRPFVESLFESSPLSRTYKTYGQGQSWKDAEKATVAYTKMNLNGEVLNWNYCVSPALPSLSTANSGYYLANQLAVTESVDENGLITKLYVNARSLKVMSRVGDGTTWLDTYYIYSPAGLLMFIIQPEGVARLTADYFAAGADKQNFLDRWSLQYQYDSEQRVIGKRIPGSEVNATGVDGWTYTVYDKWNRIVLTQDAAQRVRNEYTFFKYDRFNRSILSGLYNTTATLASLRTSADAATTRFEIEASTATGYTLTSSFPTDITETSLRIVNYYDTYTFKTYPGWDAEGGNYDFVNVTGYSQSTTTLATVKGYLTGSKVRVLNTAAKWLNAVSYYNKEYKVVQVIAETNMGGRLRSTSLYDFRARVIREQVNESISGTTKEEIYAYDHAGRPISMHYSINGATPVLMASYRYNDLGKLVEKNIHSSDNGVSFLQSIDYKYNIRGWITNMNNSNLAAQSGDTNSDVFGMEIQYNPTTTTAIGGVFTTKKYYNGNISAIKWTTDNKKVAGVEQIYGFDYDIHSRFKKGYYAKKNGSAWTSASGMFDEEVKGYDLNGNFKGPLDASSNPTAAIVRYGNVSGTKTLVDNLIYQYALNGKESNRVISINDTGNKLGFEDPAANVVEEYRYDRNGNLNFDHNKSISQIDYNYLNLTQTITYTRPNGSVDKLDYLYDAQGTLLSKSVSIGGTQVWKTDYTGVFQFDNGALSFLLTEEGRVTLNNAVFEYEYFMKDHQENVRVTYGPLKETLTYKATMEVNNAEEDVANGGFKNIYARRINPGDVNLNYTEPSNKVPVPDRAAKVNAFSSQAVGPAKSLRVLNGDAVYLETYAKFTAAPGNTSLITAAVLGAAVNSAFGIPNTGETANLYAGINANAAGAAAGIPASATIPKAYVAFLFFDDNNVFQRAGAVAITAAAFNSFEKLSRSFTADKNGYLFIYVASESNASPANVYFDDLYIIHQKTNASLQVVQASDYYPFGLAFNEFNNDRLKIVSTTPDVKYEPMIRNRYLYNGKQLQPELEVNLYNYGARMYDPAVGRWTGIDPMAHEREWLTGYNYVQNNPVTRTDPTGAFDDYFIRDNGEIVVKETDDDFDRFYVEKTQRREGDMIIRTYEFAAKLNKNENGLLAIPAEFSKECYGFKYTGARNENFISGSAFAAVLGSLKSAQVTDVSFNHWSACDGSSPKPSTSHKDGKVGDVRPLRTDFSGDRVLVTDPEFDAARNTTLIAAFKKFGWTSVLSEKNPTTNWITPGTKHYSGFTDKKTGKWVPVRHNNHYHIQKFKPNLIPYTPYRSSQACTD